MTLATIASQAPLSFADNKMVGVVVDSVLRTQPNLNAADETKLDRGAELRLLQLRDGWAQVQSGGTTAWARVVSGPMDHELEGAENGGTVVTAREDARLFVRAGKRSADDVFVTGETEMRVHGMSPDRRWVLCENKRGDIGWMETGNARKADVNLAEGDAAFVTEAGYARRRAQKLASRTMELGAGEIVTVEVRSENWALLENKRGLRGWYPLSRLSKRTSKSNQIDERVGRLVEIDRKENLRRRPGFDEDTTWPLGEGDQAAVSGVREADDGAWLLLVDDEGRWGWIPEDSTHTVAIGSATVMTRDKNSGKPKLPYSANLNTGASMSFPIDYEGKPSYTVYVGASGGRNFGDLRLGLGASVSLTRYTAGGSDPTMPQPQMGAPTMKAESFGGDFSGSLSYALSKMFSVRGSGGYSLNVDSTLRDTILQGSQNGPYGSAGVSANLTDWMSVSGSATLVYTDAFQGKNSTSKSERINLSIRPIAPLGLSASVGFSQFVGGSSMNFGGNFSYKFLPNLSAGASIRQTNVMGDSFKRGSVYLDFSL